LKYLNKISKESACCAAGGGGGLQPPTQTSPVILHPFQNPGYAVGTSYEYEKNRPPHYVAWGPLKTDTA